MEKEQRGSSLKILGCLLVAAFLQTTLVQHAPPSMVGALGRIDWLLLVTVYVGLQRDPIKSLLTGTAAGLLSDSFSGARAAVGVSGLAYVLVAYITYRIVAFIVVDNVLVRVLAVAVATIVNTSVRFIFYWLLKIQLPVLAGGETIAPAIVFELFANLIASILLYILLDRILQRRSTARMRRIEARRRRI
ncbi:MAG: rod shape-determining protein MreD [Blastocatellia bacterium]|nr:rod shape-determining protein MreD [Blastocatellia bacterium]